VSIVTVRGPCTHWDGSKTKKLTLPDFKRSNPTMVRECPWCCRIIGILSVVTTGDAPRSASFTLDDGAVVGEK